MKNIYTLTGMKSSGKTTVGKMLAREQSLPFLDLDICVEEIYEPDRTFTFREIYRMEGRERFMELEAEAARAVLDELKDSRAVLSLGGGAIENSKVMNLLEPVGFFIYLRVPMDLLLLRIEAEGLPAFLSAEDPKGEFFRIYERRAPLMEQAAELIIDSAELPPNEIVAIIRRRIGENENVR